MPNPPLIARGQFIYDFVVSKRELLGKLLRVYYRVTGAIRSLSFFEKRMKEVPQRLSEGHRNLVKGQTRSLNASVALAK
jgi:hypothetical protein